MGRATGEQDFSKSNLLKLGKWYVHIATEGFVCEMYNYCLCEQAFTKKKCFFFKSNFSLRVISTYSSWH